MLGLSLLGVSSAYGAFCILLTYGLIFSAVGLVVCLIASITAFFGYYILAGGIVKLSGSFNAAVSIR